MKYGLELEFFVTKGTKIVPAYLATPNLDGNPLLGELRTEPHDNIVNAVFELKKLLFLEKESLSKKGFGIKISPINKFNDSDLRTLRRDGQEKKDMSNLEEFSIYFKQLGKLLPRGVVKASLQISLSNNYTFRYDVSINKKDTECKKWVYSELFNYPVIIQKLDNNFAKEITEANRVKGIYAIKEGNHGKRVEYRSLPNTVDLDKIIKTLA